MKTILMLAVLFFATAHCEDKPVPEIQKAFKLVTRGEDVKRRWMATAFYISPNRLLTAAHTFKHGDRDQWIEKGGRDVHCKVIKIDYKLDLVLLETDETCDSFYRLVSNIKIIGFPFGNEKEEPVGKIDTKRIHLRCYFVPGMSGGPLVNEYGDVEGMGVENEGPGEERFCRAIPASVLVDFIK